MCLATVKRARARVGQCCRWYISFFSAAKKLSAAALSQHTPVRSTLVYMRFSLQNR
jgi:hypothetical protein